jgi:hypothetical protein
MGSVRPESVGSRRTAARRWLGTHTASDPCAVDELEFDPAGGSADVHDDGA